MLGGSKEEVGFDTGQKPEVMQRIAAAPCCRFPWIGRLNIVRAWSALRVMPPDGLPIYDQSERFPGAFTANCHSGVTLAGAHASLLAPMIAAGALDPSARPVLREALRCSGRGLTRARRPSRSWSRAAGAGAGGRLGRRGGAAGRRLPHPRHAGRAARAAALLHDGRLLRLPGRDRRRRQPPGLHGPGRARHAHPPPARRTRRLAASDGAAG